MKILILSYFFKPDLSAGSFRTTSLIDEIQRKHPDKHVDVITTVPNRYQAFKDKSLYEEHIDNISIYRAKVQDKRSGILGQLINFFLFFFFTLKITKGQQYQLVYATSSKLMTAFLGAVIATQKRAYLYLDIRDIFIDTLQDVFSKKITLFIMPFLKPIEKFTFNRANHVNLVSKGFLPYFKKYYPKLSYSFFTNGIDDIFISHSLKENNDQPHQILEVIYAGNFGDGQGLHRIVPPLAKALEGKAHFKIIGDGGKKKELIDEIKKLNVSNVEIISPVKRDILLQYYSEADILFLHLNDYDAFKKVIPSKIFEYACYQKPIWGGLSGYIVDFIDENISDAYIFSPCDVNQAINMFNKIRVGDIQKRQEFINQFSRNVIMEKMADDIFSLK